MGLFRFAGGALISMVVVLTVLPSLFMLLDKLICKTSAGFKPDNVRFSFIGELHALNMAIATLMPANNFM